MQAARHHVRRWLSLAKPTGLASRSPALLPRWQQQQQLLRHSLPQHRMKSSIPAMQRLDDDDDSDDESLDDHLSKHMPLEKADWFERSLSVTPMPHRYKRPRQNTAVWDPTLLPDEPTIPLYTPPAKDESHRLGAMSPEDIDRWLDGFEIPAEAMSLKGKSAHEIRELYAKQLRLEQAIYEMSVETNNNTTASVVALQKGSEINTAKSYINKWGSALTEAILDEIAEVSDNNRDATAIDRAIYGPVLYLIAPEKLARIVVTTVLNHVLMEADGVKFVKITLALGREIQEEISKEKQKSRSSVPGVRAHLHAHLPGQQARQHPRPRARVLRDGRRLAQGAPAQAWLCAPRPPREELLRGPTRADRVGPLAPPRRQPRAANARQGLRAHGSI